MEDKDKSQFDLAKERINKNIRYIESLRYVNELEEIIEFSEQRILSIFLIHIFLLENLTNLLLLELITVEDYKGLLGKAECDKINKEEQTFGQTTGYLEKIFKHKDFQIKMDFFGGLIFDLGKANKKRIKFVHKYFNGHENDVVTIQELQNTITELKLVSIKIIDLFQATPLSTLDHCRNLLYKNL